MAIKLTVMPLDMDPGSKPIIKIFNKEELTLGRLPSNDIVLNRPEVSGIHARLRIEHDEFGEVSKLYITDLGSSNGTLVEKNPLKARVEVQMMPNERIFIGSYVIKPTTQVDEEGENDSRTTIEVPTNFNKNDISYASKTQDFDNVKFEAIDSGTSEYDSYSDDDSEMEVDGDIEETEEEKITVNSSLQSPKNLFSSIMFGEEPSMEVPENESSVLRSMYSAPVGDSHYREPEQRLSPYGKAYADEDEEEEEVKVISPASSDHAMPSWIQRKVDSIKENDATEEKEVFHEEVKSGVNKMMDDYSGSKEKTSPVLPSPNSPIKHVDRFSIRVTAGEDTEQITKVQAKAYTTIKGRVMRQGKPVAGVSVRSSAFGNTATDALGYYEFSRVLEDTVFNLSFSKDRFLIEPSSFQGSATVGGSDMLIEATKLCSIKGVVVHNGKPLEGVEVSAGELGKRVTGPDGAYQFDSVPEGREYDLVLAKEGYAFQS